MKPSQTLQLSTALLALSLGACAGQHIEEQTPVAARRASLTVGGCKCPTSGNCAALSYSDIPADGKYYVTTFGGGSDTQGMSCGGTADGTWAYIADVARFGCGALVVISAGGKHCVAKVADCGPNRCVEQAASYSGCASHFPIIDASPLITKHLLGMSGVGWSDKKIVTATIAPPGAAIGCPGVLPAPPADSGPPPPKDTGSQPPPDIKPRPPPDPPPAPDAKPPPASDPSTPPSAHDAGSLPPQVAPDAAVNLGTDALTGGCQLTPPGQQGRSASLPTLLALLALLALATPRRRSQ